MQGPLTGFHQDLHNIFWQGPLQDFSDLHSTAQGGGGRFEDRKARGVSCCVAWMVEQAHWWTDRCVRLWNSLPLFLYPSISLSLCLYPSISLSLYVSITLCLYLSISLCLYVSISLCLYLSMSLSLSPSLSPSPSPSPSLSLSLSLHLSLSFSISICLSCLSLHLALAVTSYLSVSTTKAPLRHHQTTRTPPRHHPNTTRDHRKTTNTPPRHHQVTTETPPRRPATEDAGTHPAQAGSRETRPYETFGRDSRPTSAHTAGHITRELLQTKSGAHRASWNPRLLPYEPSVDTLCGEKHHRNQYKTMRRCVLFLIFSNRKHGTVLAAQWSTAALAPPHRAKTSTRSRDCPICFSIEIARHALTLKASRRFSMCGLSVGFNMFNIL